VDRTELGRWGEAVACSYLRLLGYRILARNFRAGRLEIDVVAAEGGEIVFVEVKVRCDDEHGGAVGAVGFKKQRGLSKAAACFLARHDLEDRPCRFDVVAVQLWRAGEGFELRHVRRAFDSRWDGGF